MHPNPTRYYVYVLMVEFTGRVFYVGKGCGNRYKQHEAEWRSGCQCRKCQWFTRAKASGTRATATIVYDAASETDALTHEARLIKRYGLHTLTNHHSQGGSSYRDGARTREESRICAWCHKRFVRMHMSPARCCSGRCTTYYTRQRLIGELLADHTWDDF